MYGNFPLLWTIWWNISKVAYDKAMKNDEQEAKRTNEVFRYSANKKPTWYKKQCRRLHSYFYNQLQLSHF